MTQKKLFENLSKLGDVKAQISALNVEKNTYNKSIVEYETQIEVVGNKLKDNQTELDKHLDLSNKLVSSNI